MKCVLINARSIVNKIDDLHILVSEHSPDCIFITETWLCDAHDDSLLALNNYIIFRKDRSNGSDPHGGVLIAVKSGLNPIKINLDTIYECVVVDILQNMVRIRLCCIYRPPSMSDAETKTFFYKLTPALNSSFNLCLAGDFNVPNIDWNSFTATDRSGSVLLNFVNELSLKQFVNEPSRGNNFLDLIFGSVDQMDLSSVKNTAVHKHFSTSDHSFITFEINCVKTQEKSHVKYYNAADWDLIRSCLSTFDWDEIFFGCEGNCEAMWLMFRDTIRNVSDTHVPTRTCNQKTKLPWFNNYLKRRVRKKNRM